MKTVISLALLSIACSAAADVQNIKYLYDDSDAVYSIVSFVDSGSAIQATVQRSGTYFTNYTKLELDCANRNVRHMGMYNSLSGVEKAQFDQMEGRIIDGSIADEVGKVLCKDTSLTASKAAPQTEDLPTEKQTDDNT
ncbi:MULTISPECIES: hypothetical protein [unclassified Pseudomonas]|uniref:hypothetical protein n=1 Tax=unclassified Pseudomonas TaxID=196821 RepID=UPI000871796C|nr:MULTISPECIES: hypothetical protein [unclassified Pseudomonas]SCW71731.1 hypothetical protein SAMN03159424_02607 [Pseudomonas sp. NFACC05-1]SCZ26284.1 hypothetical protein SAMN03159405_01539 [Pseudomonas sp. NFACC44-2]SDA71994.1 hypothetical protein SAMN03159429_03160 [Pseudomonas sp. NFACC51]SEI76609.1 hypothetical protein SAMN03159298_01336 [Pseudomonas sp. NFACC07-1]SFH32742.1 hypothetical protein SAMN03159302_01154 [Pseudomonas sp. NFACC54]